MALVKKIKSYLNVIIFFRLTKELNDDAQRWAEKLAEMDKFIYRQNSKYGENLYCLWSSDTNAWPIAKEVCK